jgi:hypothetical protein
MKVLYALKFKMCVMEFISIEAYKESKGLQLLFVVVGVIVDLFPGNFKCVKSVTKGFHFIFKVVLSDCISNQ